MTREARTRRPNSVRRRAFTPRARRIDWGVRKVITGTGGILMAHAPPPWARPHVGWTPWVPGIERNRADSVAAVVPTYRDPPSGRILIGVGPACGPPAGPVGDLGRDCSLDPVILPTGETNGGAVGIGRCPH